MRRTARGRRAGIAGGLLSLAFVLAGCAGAGQAAPTTTAGPPPLTAVPPQTSPPTTPTTPPPTTTPATTTTTKPKAPASADPALSPLPTPTPLQPFSSSPHQGEGTWRPAGRLVEGHPAVYETFLQEPGTSDVAGIAWMDPHLLRAQLYSGAESPGYGPWKWSAPIQPAAAASLAVAFNGGFKLQDTHGGYYSEGRLVAPFADGGAALVIYSNGVATVGQWGRDVTMTPQVVAVRQNDTLLVDGGRPVPGLNPSDNAQFGFTLHGVPNVWRAGIGVTADGALVYVSGPSMEVTQLADLLARAGCIRAMTLDINPDWTVLATFNPPAGQLASPANGQRLLSGMVQGPYTFFESWWSRDFIAMSAR